MGPWTEWLWWQRREWCKLYFHSPRLTWLQLLLSAGSANSRDQTESQIWHHSSWCPANNLVTRWQYWTNYLVERVNWVSIGVDSYADYGFAFAACNASAKTTIHGLGESLTHHHVIPHSIASDKGTHFTAREVNPLVLQCSPPFWSNWIDKKLQAHFEETKRVPIRWQHLGGLARVLEKAVFALNQCLIYGTVSPIVRDPGPRNQDVQRGIVPLTFILSDSQEIFISYSHNPKFC